MCIILFDVVERIAFGNMMMCSAAAMCRRILVLCVPQIWCMVFGDRFAYILCAKHGEANVFYARDSTTRLAHRFQIPMEPAFAIR